MSGTGGSLGPDALFVADSVHNDPCLLGKVDRLADYGERVDAATAIAEFLHDMAFPSIMKGERVGQVVYNATHALTLDNNLFDDAAEASAFNEFQPVIVELVSDGGTIRLGAVKPGERITEVVRVSVHSTTAQIGKRCAMRLYHFFLNDLGGFERIVKRQSGTQFHDLTVNAIVPNETPQLVDDSGNRWHRAFRLRVEISRR